MNRNEIVLIRGVPGSGKTTMAKELFPDHVLCEADQFFETDDGYVFDGAKIKEAHAYCLEKAKDALKNGLDVVVANTFTRKWEMANYINLPYNIRIIEATGDYKNVHGVPDEVVERMRSRFESI